MQALISMSFQSQSCNTMYNQDTSVLMSFEALILDAIKNIHEPVSISYTCIVQTLMSGIY
jgi:hypothetical protein